MIKKERPEEAIMGFKSIGRFVKYPKFTLLGMSFLLAYLLLLHKDKLPFQEGLESLGLLGIFITGMLYSYGFTAAPASAFFFSLGAHDSILAKSVIGGFGSLIADVILFELIRHSFADEVIRLSRERFIRKTLDRIPYGMKEYLFPIIAAFVIASPLPDEIGVFMLASYRKISLNTFMILSYFLNTFGIYSLLTIGRLAS